jgi:hypothetical protein
MPLRILPPFSADADLRAGLTHESSAFLIRSLPSPIIPVQPLTSLFVSTFAVLEGSSFVSVPLRATAFGSNLGSKGHCPFAGGPRHRREDFRTEPSRHRRTDHLWADPLVAWTSTTCHGWGRGFESHRRSKNAKSFQMTVERPRRPPAYQPTLGKQGGSTAVKMEAALLHGPIARYEKTHLRPRLARPDHPFARTILCHLPKPPPRSADAYLRFIPRCESAWGPDADRHAKVLIIIRLEGSSFGA